MMKQVDRNEKKRWLNIAWAFTFMLAGFAGCNEAETGESFEDEDVSALVLNEGNFSDSNGSVTRFGPLTGEGTQNAFEQANNRPMGSIVQAGVIAGERFYLVNNNSDKIEITELPGLESLHQIDLGGEDGLTPAGFAVVDESQGYVSSLYTNEVAVVDLEERELTGERISVGDNPQDLLVLGNRLFVANSGFGEDNTVSVIDTDSHEVLATVEVGHGPRQLMADSGGRVWVLAGGYQAFDEDWNRDPENDIEGRIDLLNGSTGDPVGEIETGGFPVHLALGETVGRAWVVNQEEVQQINFSTLELEEQPYLEGSYNGIGFFPLENQIYLLESLGYDQSGQVTVHNLEGDELDMFQAGIAPFEVFFILDLN